VNFLTLPGEDNLVLSSAPAALVKLNGAEPLAGLVETHFDPDDPGHYASIHSNPPGPAGGFPGLTLHRFGQGRCLYLASPVLRLQQDAQQTFAAWLLETYAPPGRLVHTNAPAAVEISLLRSRTAEAWLVGFANYQKELPNLPVHGIQVELSLDGRLPEACTLVSSGQALPFSSREGVLRFEIPRLETIEMVEVCFSIA
jgi:hypothetical protein